MSWDIFPKDKIEYFLEKLKGKLDGKADSGEVEGLKTVTGNPITLTDASETYVQGLTVELAPKQDLHGYDFPWVGGAGKNKLPMTVANIKAANTEGTWNGNTYSYHGVIFTILTDDAENVIGFDVDGTVFGGSVEFSVCNFTGTDVNDNLPNGDYITSGDCTVNKHQDGSYAGTWINTSFTITDSIKAGKAYIYLVNGRTIDHQKYYPMIRLATESDQTFASYSNICPITGYTEVVVEDVGKNRLDLESIMPNGAYSNNGKTYTISAIGARNLVQFSDTDVTSILSIKSMSFGGTSFRFEFYDHNDTLVQNAYVDASGGTYSIVAASKVKVNYGNNGQLVLEEPMLRPSSDTDPTFEPYTTRSATIPFSQTLYGGRSNFTDGGTEETQVMEELTKDSNITLHESGTNTTAFKVTNFLSEIPDQTISQLSSHFVYNIHADATSINAPNTFVVGTSKTLYFQLSNDIATTPEEVKTWIGDGSIDICATLQAPNEITTPATPLKLLQDTNNLTTNGTTITIDYIPNNSIGDAVKASEEYTDRAVETKGGVQKTVIFDDLVRIADEITLSLPSSYNFIVFEVNYMYDGATGSAIYSSLIDSINIPANYSGTSHWMELRKAGDIVSVRGDTDIDQGGALLKITAF